MCRLLWLTFLAHPVCAIYYARGQKTDTETECKSTNKSNEHHTTCKQATNVLEYTLQL